MGTWVQEYLSYMKHECLLGIFHNFISYHLFFFHSKIRSSQGDKTRIYFCRRSKKEFKYSPIGSLLKVVLWSFLCLDDICSVNGWMLASCGRDCYLSFWESLGLHQQVIYLFFRLFLERKHNVFLCSKEAAFNMWVHAWTQQKCSVLTTDLHAWL